MERIQPGAGRIVLRAHGTEAVLAEMSSAYPLKLLSPRIAQERVSVVYILTYGGGLVGGDRVALSVEVHDGSALVILSQGSTKVFKMRPGGRLSTRPYGFAIDAATTQRMDVLVSSDSALFLLPDPVTCFRLAKYNQLQSFRLTGSASAVVLDWVTSGRRSIGEEWVFSRYYSLNEVWVDGERIVKDAMLLEEQQSHIHSLPTRTLADTLSPYSCYATVIMYGPLTQSVLHQLTAEYEAISVFKCASLPNLLWSLSTIRRGRGCVVRVAAKETEDVKIWLSGALRGLEEIVGTDVYRKAFG